MSSVITEAALVDVLCKIKKETWRLTNVQESITVGIFKSFDNLTVIFEIQVYFA